MDRVSGFGFHSLVADLGRRAVRVALKVLELPTRLYGCVVLACFL